MIPGKRYEVRLSGMSQWLTVMCERATETLWTGRDDTGRMVSVRADDEVRELPGVSGAEPLAFVDAHSIGFDDDASGDNLNFDPELQYALLQWAARKTDAMLRDRESQLELAMHWGAEACAEWERRWRGMRERGDRAYRELDRQIERIDERVTAAYAAGRRDALAVAEHRSLIERDVIEAAKEWALAMGRDFDEAEEVLNHAVDVLIEAERAKEGG